MRRPLDGWESVQRRGADGSVDSDERVRSERPVVERSERGARTLGDLYWLEVARASGGAVRRRNTAAGVEIRLFGFGPSLLRFGPPEIGVEAGGVFCRFPIRGGLLARAPRGSITLSQSGEEQPQLRAAISGFVPRVALKPLYDQLQRRFHVRISRRYFWRLIREAPR